MSPIAQVDCARLQELLASGVVTLVDVRTDAEVARGMIEGAKHIPLNQLPGRQGELSPSDVTVVYCQSGGRSAQACAWLAGRGFERVYNLEGGVLAWLRGGQPLLPPG